MAARTHKGWILVAGTGRIPLPSNQQWMAEKLGHALARSGYGLVTGGWPGVDTCVADAFARSLGRPPDDLLIRVVPKGHTPPRTAGTIAEVSENLPEWVEALNRANVVILIGGLGGTYETYLHAKRRQIPVIPIPGTEGDARSVFDEMLAGWELKSPFTRVSRAEFSRLDVAIELESDSDRALQTTMKIVNLELPHAVEPESGQSEVVPHLDGNTSGIPPSTPRSVALARESVSQQKTGALASQVDFAILTAIPVERLAVCAAFELTNENRVKRETRVYWQGRLALDDEFSYQIVVAQPADMGNIDAALLTSDVIRHWQPRAILLVGIAATADENVNLGDVVVGRTVYYYEQGKVTHDGTKPQPEMLNADSELLNHVIALPEWDGKLLVDRPDGSRDAPTVHHGVIASGEKVIADANVRDQIASGHRKILAIEMEGYGFSKAVWQSSTKTKHLAIRGICDNASNKKTDLWHKYAAAAAAGFARHFLLDRPLEPLAYAGPALPAKDNPNHRTKAFGSRPHFEQSKSNQRHKPSEHIEPTVFFYDRTCDAFPGLRGIKEYNNPKEAIERLSDLLKEPLCLSRYCPIWTMDAMGSMPIDRFTKLDSEHVKIGITRFRLAHLWAYRSRAYWRDFVLLKFKADDPTGLYPSVLQEEMDACVRDFGTYTEEYGVWNGEFITLAEYGDGAVIRNGRSKPTQGSEREIRHLTPGAIIITSQFSPLHARDDRNFDRVHASFISRFIAGTATAHDLVTLVETLPRHPQDD